MFIEDQALLRSCDSAPQPPPPPSAVSKLSFFLSLPVCRRHRLHRKKSFSIFRVAGMPLTKLSLGGNIDVIFKLFPPRQSLVSDILAGDGNIKKLFYGVLPGEGAGL